MSAEAILSPAEMVGLDVATRKRRRTPQRQYDEMVRRDPCSYCGAIGGDRRPDDRLIRDHIVAAQMGGPDDWANRTAACEGCNVSKGRATLLAFLLWRRYGETWRAVAVAQALARSIRDIGRPV